jgi:DNA-directed RNA polymerase specialized sigma24 family protein
LNHERATGGVDLSEFLALVGDLRPELHRYCARLTGSVMDGEDVVQDSLASAFVALKTLEASPSMRAWLFRIAHNRALDLLRRRGRASRGCGRNAGFRRRGPLGRPDAPGSGQGGLAAICGASHCQAQRRHPDGR